MDKYLELLSEIHLLKDQRSEILNKYHEFMYPKQYGGPVEHPDHQLGQAIKDLQLKIGFLAFQNYRKEIYNLLEVKNEDGNIKASE